MASAIHQWLTAHSTFDEVDIDPTGNVVATRGSGPYFLLCSHMDTVPGRLPVSFTGGVIRGRGAVDAKASLAAMCVAASIAVTGGASNLMYAAIVGEETNGKGMQEVLAGRHEYMGGVFGEPSGGGIVIGYKGRLGLGLDIRGKAAHASSAALGANAVEIGMKLALGLKDELEARGCTATVTVIKGGRAENTIPAKCKVAMDVRIPSPTSLNEVLKVVEANKADGVEMTTSELTPPVSVGRANRVFSAISAAVQESGMRPRALIKAGTSDMNLFYLTTKAPCVAYGPGDASLSHTDSESVTESEYLRSVQIYTSTIRKVLKA